MKLVPVFAIVLATVCGAEAQSQAIGFSPQFGPICASPWGPVPCSQLSPPPMLPMPMAMPNPMPPPNFNQPYPQPPQMAAPTLSMLPSAGGGGNFPGAGMYGPDAEIVASIVQGCGGEPICMASSWGSVEIDRCRKGIFEPGGCFGPNGEIMKVLNRVLPHNLQPQTIINNVKSDIENGPGENNDLVGKNGFVCQQLLGGC